MITLETVRAHVGYDPATGVIVSKRTGKRVGWLDRDGYLQVRLPNNVRRFAHRVAWLLHYGAWPEGELDHINGNRTDNRIANLRPATRSQNLANTKLLSRNTSGFKGVSFSKKLNRWQASICVNQRQQHLGFFDSPEAAHAAYRSAAEERFGVYARAA